MTLSCCLSSTFYRTVCPTLTPFVRTTISRLSSSPASPTASSTKPNHVLRSSTSRFREISPSCVRSTLRRPSRTMTVYGRSSVAETRNGVFASRVTCLHVQVMIRSGLQGIICTFAFRGCVVGVIETEGKENKFREGFEKEKEKRQN